MTRSLWLSIAVLAGLAAGGAAALAFQAADRSLTDPPAAAEAPLVDGANDRHASGDTGTDDATGGSSGPAGATAPVAPGPAGDDRVLLVWTAGGLPDNFEEQVAGLPGVQHVTSVAGELVDLVATHAADGTPVEELDEGWAIPWDALAIDPRGYAPLLPKADVGTVLELAEGEVLLGETSAELRRLSPGDTVTLAGGHELTVAAVLDDALVGGAEAVVSRDGAEELGITTDRFLLLAFAGDRAELEPAIRRLTDVEVRVRGPGETPYLRHGDAVLPQARVKAEFGEFAYRVRSDGLRIEQDPDWVADHLDNVEVPILGEVRCHRRITKQLTGALRSLVDSGLADLVDPEQYAGCHAPRLIAPGAAVSRHAWGIALDLNADDNLHGDPPDQDRRLVETFARWGFTWGGFWLVPDAMHLEWVGSPDPDAEPPDDTSTP